MGRFVSLAIGAVLTWIGWRHWRLRDRETISVLETAILRATDEEPLPITGLDRVLGRLQAILGLTFGPFFLFVGVVALLV